VRATWALRPWGFVRAAVALCGIALAASWWLFDPAASEGGSAFWVAVTVFAGGAGLVSAARVRVLLSEGDLPRGEVATAMLPRMIGDAVVVLLLATVGMALRIGIRSGVGATSAGWTTDLLRLLITTPIAAFIVFVVGAVLGGLVLIAVGGVRHIARMPRGDVPASTRWFVGAALALAIAGLSTIVVGLTDTTPATQEGTAALIAFFVGPVTLAAPWQVVVLWLARLGFGVVAVCLVAGAVSRGRERRD